MRCRDIIVDDRGEIYEAPFDGLRLAWGCDGDTDAFIRYVIRNLGFVRLQQQRHGLVVTLRPSATNPVTFASAIFLISDLHTQRVILSCLEESWIHILCRDGAEARSKLLHTMDQAEEAREQAFLRERRRLDEVPSNSSMSTLLTFWADCRGSLDDGQLTIALREILRDRFALVSTRGNGESLIIEDWGYGASSFGVSWLRNCKGLEFENQPDYRYGRAAAVAYREVVQSGEPSFDIVDALTSNAGCGKKRIGYRRLILPLRRRGRQPWLLSTSLLDASIDLQKIGGHKA